MKKPTPFAPVTQIRKSDPIWAMYVKEARARDLEMLEVWSTRMDVLLVFVSIFYLNPFQSSLPDTSIGGFILCNSDGFSHRGAQTT